MSKPLPASPNDKESELGTLIVVLLKARNLNDKHSFRKSDVFAQATLNGAHKRTPVDIKGGQHPEWDGEVRFPVMKSTSAKFRTLEVACYSQEPRSEDLMGKGILDITQTLQTGEFDDWVPLEIDGVQRGDIYLEMTYYTNAPPPSHASAANKLLSVVQNQSIGLSRRPSNLSPAERLSRPPVSRPPDQSSNYVYGPYPPSSRLNEQHSLQKPVLNSGPNAVPASLIPTHAAESSQKGQNSQQHGQAVLPTILRPGPGPPNGSPPSTSSGPRSILRPQQNEFSHTRNPSSSPPSHHLHVGPANPYISLPQGLSSNPYIGSGGSSTQSPNPYIGSASGSISNSTGSTPVQGPYVGYSSPPDGQPVIWRQESTPVPSSLGQFAFPGPLLPDRQQSSYWYNQRPSTAEGDPYLQARYQTPLPLPPETSPVSKSTWSSPPKSTTPLPNIAHFEALKQAEDEARKRREQELKDLELAMELDRQLNIDSSAPSNNVPPTNTNGGMPGGW